MNKNDFELIAMILNKHKPEPEDGWVCDLWKNIVEAFATEFPKFNYKFDQERFIKACGLEEEDNV